jgi:hypothetical protein
MPPTHLSAPGVESAPVAGVEITLGGQPMRAMIETGFGPDGTPEDPWLRRWEGVLD